VQGSVWEWYCLLSIWKVSFWGSVRGYPVWIF